MPELKDFILEKNFVTDRISTQVRIIAVGLLATTWSLLIGQLNILTGIAECFRIHFILISIIAIIALVLDFLQYKFSYLNLNKKIKSMHENKLNKSEYEEDRYYKCSIYFFVGKQYILLAGVAYFIMCMVKIIIS
jgi:hypothetical protein